MGRNAIATTIDKDGPFFVGNPLADLDQNIAAMMADLRDSIESDIRAQLRAGQGSRYRLSKGLKPSRLSDRLQGRSASLTGKAWKHWVSVGLDKSGTSATQAIALYAAGSLIEGREHPFKRTSTRVRAALRADLARGLD